MPLFDSQDESQIKVGDSNITGSKSAILVGGLGANNSASLFRLNDNGELLVSGSFTADVEIASVEQGNSGSVDQSWYMTITDGTKKIGVDSSSPVYTSGSVSVEDIIPITIGGYADNITASILIAASNIIQEITGTVDITSISTPVQVNQGLSGSLPWKIAIKDENGNDKGVSANPITINADTLPLPISASTEATLNAIRDNIGENIASPAADTLMARVQELIDLLTLIKDTDGIQTIDEIIRLGDVDRNGINSVVNNAIRRLENRSSLTSPDGTLDVDVVDDNNINRLETRTSIVGEVSGSSSETRVTVINDTENVQAKRLQTEARIAPGSTINIGTNIPANPAALEIGFLENGGSENMLVNGSVTPVTFSFAPLTGKTISLQDVLVVFTADDFEFDGNSFGPNSKLTNGILVQTFIDGVTTNIFNIKQNEDFLRIPGRLPLVNNTGPKDVLSSAFSFGGLVKISEPGGDEIRVIIRDNLTSIKFKYLTFTSYGVED